MLGWVATISQVFGALCVANGAMLQGYAFCLFGASCWFSIAAYRQDAPLATMSAAFVLININGLVFWG